MRFGCLLPALILAPASWGQDIVIRSGDSHGSPPAAARDSGDSKSITITITVDGNPVSGDPGPAEPPANGTADAGFAGAARMYIRGLPLGWRRVAGQVGNNITTVEQLNKALDDERKLAANGLARRLAARWSGAIDAGGNIIDPKPIKQSLIDAAGAAEAGIR